MSIDETTERYDLSEKLIAVRSSNLRLSIKFGLPYN